MPPPESPKQKPPALSPPIISPPSPPPSEKSLAEKLHEDRTIYALYSIIDGPSNAASAISYVMQVGSEGDSLPYLDRMRDWLMTPWGMAIAALEMTIITLIAVFGSLYKDNAKELWQRVVARTWPYVRDGIKALKNAYKAVRSTFFMLTAFGLAATVLGGWVLPLSLGFGLISLANKFWKRTMVSQRKKMQEANEILVRWHVMTDTEKQKKTTSNSVLSDLHLQVNSTIDMMHISRQSRTKRALLYASAAFEGFIQDGLYLCAGVYVLCILAPEMALIVSLFSVFYVLTAVIRALYEEHGFQDKLDLTIMDAELAYLNAKKPCTQADDTRIQTLTDDKKALKAPTYLSALGEGIRNGLSAYSMMTGGLFAAAFFTPIPLAVLLGVLIAGFVGMVGFCAHMVYQTYCYKRDHQDKPVNMRPDAHEMGRSFFSGIRQGPKIINNFILVGLRGSRFAFVATCIVSGIQAVIGTIKAYAKGFGQPNKESDNSSQMRTVSSSDLASPRYERPPLPSPLNAANDTEPRPSGSGNFPA